MNEELNSNIGKLSDKKKKKSQFFVKSKSPQRSRGADLGE